MKIVIGTPDIGNTIQKVLDRVSQWPVRCTSFKWKISDENKKPKTRMTYLRDIADPGSQPGWWLHCLGDWFVDDALRRRFFSRGGGNSEDSISDQCVMI